MSDVAFEKFSGQVDAEDLYRSFTHTFVCPASGHLWVFSRGLDADPVGFAPLDSGTGG